MQALWDAAVDRFGRVDVWINNAGVAHTTQHIVDIPPDDVAAMVTTNMLGTIYGSQVAVRGMTAQGRGSLFNVLGGGSDGKIREYMGVYGATKRGLKMFTDALIKETAGGPVLVGEIRPGILITDGWLREAHAAQDGYVEANRKALNVLGRPRRRRRAVDRRPGARHHQARHRDRVADARQDRRPLQHRRLPQARRPRQLRGLSRRRTPPPARRGPRTRGVRGPRA